ncbi:MAG: hypothetical protein HYZ13_16850 [Acidobacteria bacterium]|nr:hypothetical protein [Acidobacteriota bacterium]
MAPQKGHVWQRLQSVVARMRHFEVPPSQRAGLLDQLLLDFTGRVCPPDPALRLDSALLQTLRADPDVQAAFQGQTFDPLADGPFYLTLRQNLLTREAEAYRSLGGYLTNPWITDLVLSLREPAAGSLVLDTASDIGTFLLLTGLRARRHGRDPMPRLLGAEPDAGARLRAQRAATLLDLQDQLRFDPDLPEDVEADLLFCHPPFSSRALQGKGLGWDLVHQSLKRLAPEGEAFVLLPASYASSAKHLAGLIAAHHLASLRMVAAVPDLAAFRHPLLLQFKRGRTSNRILMVEASGRRKDLLAADLAAAIRQGRKANDQISETVVPMAFQNAHPGDPGFDLLPRLKDPACTHPVDHPSFSIEVIDQELSRQTHRWNEAWIALKRLHPT